MDLDLGAPAPADGFYQPFVARAALIGNREAPHDLQFVGADRGLRSRDRLGQHLQVENLFFFAAEHREDAVRWQFGEGLAKFKIALELLAPGFLAATHGPGPY